MRADRTQTNTTNSSTHSILMLPCLTNYSCLLYKFICSISVNKLNINCMYADAECARAHRAGVMTDTHRTIGRFVFVSPAHGVWPVDFFFLRPSYLAACFCASFQTFCCPIFSESFFIFSVQHTYTHTAPLPQSVDAVRVRQNRQC